MHETKGCSPIYGVNMLPLVKARIPLKKMGTSEWKFPVKGLCNVTPWQLFLALALSVL
jgi:hypothetical protein